MGVSEDEHAADFATANLEFGGRRGRTIRVNREVLADEVEHEMSDFYEWDAEDPEVFRLQPSAIEEVTDETVRLVEPTTEDASER